MDITILLDAGWSNREQGVKLFWHSTFGDLEGVNLLGNKIKMHVNFLYALQINKSF